MSVVRGFNASYHVLLKVKNNPSKYSLPELAAMYGRTPAAFQHLLDSGALVKSRAKVVLHPDAKRRKVFAAITVKLGQVGEDKLYFYDGGASLPPIER